MDLSGLNELKQTELEGSGLKETELDQNELIGPKLTKINQID